jgi:hypothetical protein
VQEASQRDIGFILITHNKPQQISRLVGRLNQLYNFPAISIHHDFSQCDLPPEATTGSVSVVRPHLKTGWAKFSVTQATLLAFSNMLERPDCPQWFVLLSGADYPIKPAGRVLQDLNDQNYDAHIDSVLIDPETWDDPKIPFKAVGYERYLRYHIFVPWISRQLKFRWRALKLPQRISSPFLPWSSQLRCYAGSHFFSLNRGCAEFIVREAKSNRALYDYFKQFDFSEEAIFQTLLSNAPSLRIHNKNYRYYDWSLGGPHPKTLQMEDLPRLLASPHHFARKFDGDNFELADAVDAAVDAM